MTCLASTSATGKYGSQFGKADPSWRKWTTDKWVPGILISLTHFWRPPTQPYQANYSTWSCLQSGSNRFSRLFLAVQGASLDRVGSSIGGAPQRLKYHLSLDLHFEIIARCIVKSSFARARIGISVWIIIVDFAEIISTPPNDRPWNHLLHPNGHPFQGTSLAIWS